MTQHTPGPWHPFNAGWITSARGPICAMYAMKSGNYEDDTEGLSNARLIAAAPELLEALKELADLFQDTLTGDYRPDSFTFQPARAAIAKAEGRT
jgi:hypothetical protein